MAEWGIQCKVLYKNHLPFNLFATRKKSVIAFHFFAFATDCKTNLQLDQQSLRNILKGS